MALSVNCKFKLNSSGISTSIKDNKLIREIFNKYESNFVTFDNFVAEVLLLSGKKSTAALGAEDFLKYVLQMEKLSQTASQMHTYDTNKKEDSSNPFIAFLNTNFNLRNNVFPATVASRGKIEKRTGLNEPLKQFVSHGEVAKYGGLGNIYSRAQAYFNSLQLLKERMLAEQNAQVKKITEIGEKIDTDSTIGDVIGKNKDFAFSDEELNTIDELGYKIIENGAVNDNTARNWFGFTSTNDFFVLKSLSLNNNFIDEFSNREKDSKQPAYQGLVNDAGLQLLQKQTNAVVVIGHTINSSGEKVNKVKIDIKIYLDEIYNDLVSKTDLGAKHPKNVLIASIYTALRHRAFFQTEGINYINQIRNNYIEYLKLATKTHNYGDAKHYKELIANINTVGFNYVPRLADKSYFTEDVINGLLTAFNNYNLSTAIDKQLKFDDELKQIASDNGLDFKSLKLMTFDDLNGAVYDDNALLLLRYLVKSGGIDNNNNRIETQKQLDDAIKMLGLNISTQTSQQLLAMWTKTNYTEDLVQWNSLLNRSIKQRFIPYSTNIKQAAYLYAKGGVRKVYVDRMKYQFKVNKYLALKEASNPDEHANETRVFDSLQRGLAGIEGGLSNSTKAILAMQKNPAAVPFIYMAKLAFGIPVLILGDKGASKEFKFIGKHSTELSAKELKIINQYASRLEYAIFLASNFLGGLRNAVGSTRDHFVLQGWRVFYKPNKVSGYNENHDLVEVDLNAEVDYSNIASFVEASKVFDDYFAKLNDEDASSLWRKLRKTSDYGVLLKLLLKTKNHAIEFDIPFMKLTETINRRNGYKTALYRGLKMGYTLVEARAYATGYVNNVDAIYDVTGKIGITNSDVGQRMFKFYNWGANNVRLKKSILADAKTLGWLELKGLCNGSFGKNHKILNGVFNWATNETNVSTPLAIIFRYALAEYLLYMSGLLGVWGLLGLKDKITFGLSDWTTVLITSLYKTLTGTQTSDNSPVMQTALDAQHNLPLPLWLSIAIGVITNDRDTDEENKKNKKQYNIPATGNQSIDRLITPNSIGKVAGPFYEKVETWLDKEE